jgi:hypothetical protein
MDGLHLEEMVLETLACFGRLKENVRRSEVARAVGNERRINESHLEKSTMKSRKIEDCFREFARRLLREVDEGGKGKRYSFEISVGALFRKGRGARPMFQKGTKA